MLYFEFVFSSTARDLYLTWTKVSTRANKIVSLFREWIKWLTHFADPFSLSLQRAGFRLLTRARLKNAQIFANDSNVRSFLYRRKGKRGGPKIIIYIRPANPRTRFPRGKKRVSRKFAYQAQKISVGAYGRREGRFFINTAFDESSDCERPHRRIFAPRSRCVCHRRRRNRARGYYRDLVRKLHRPTLA